MADTDRLIRAWIAWDRSPRSPETARERLNAMAAAGLPALETQTRIARNRARGMSIPDAVQAAINDSQETRPPLKLVQRPITRGR